MNKSKIIKCSRCAVSYVFHESKAENCPNCGRHNEECNHSAVLICGTCADCGFKLDNKNE